jgi:hypothetical protein
METMGIFVQIWWFEDDEVTRKAKEMAEQTAKKQEGYVRRLHLLPRLFCEYAAKELGYQRSKNDSKATK